MTTKLVLFRIAQTRHSWVQMAFNARYYEILGVDDEASQQVIEHVYKNLQKAYHPDMHPENRAFYTEKIKSINEAYETLRNPSKREEYDRLLGEQQDSNKSKLKDIDYENDIARSITSCPKCGRQLGTLELVCSQCGAGRDIANWWKHIPHYEHFLTIIRYDRIKKGGIKTARISVSVLDTFVSRILRSGSH